MRSNVKYAFCLFLVILSMSVSSQNTLYFDPSSLKEKTINLLDHCQVYIDASRNLGFEDVLNAEMLDYNEARNQGLLKGGIFERNIWFKVTLKPESPLNRDEIAIHFPNASRIEIYEFDNGHLNISKGGRFYSVNKEQIVNNKYAFPLKILGDRERDILIKTSELDRFKNELFITQSSNLATERQVIREERFNEINFYVALISIFLFTGLLLLIRYFQNRELFMLWYSFYLLGLSLYFVENYEYMSKVNILFERFAHAGIILKLLPATLFCLLTFYIRDILEIDHSKSLYSHFKILFYSAIFTLFSSLAFILLSPICSISQHVRMIFVIPFLVASTIFALKAIITKDRINRIVGFGLMIVSIACFILTIVFLLNLFGHYHLIFEFSLLLELCFLNAAIAYKVSQVNKNLLSTQASLLEAEKSNLQIQKKLNEELNDLVLEKTKDIIEQNKQIALQENLKTEAEFKEKIANAELKALKAQMNPHFIFNCLNAIQNLVLKNESEKASRYLGVFSSFIRKVLSYSEVRNISLEEELDLCQLYLQMEQLRFEDGFEYEIQVDPDCAVDFIKVPPMLLQPILENAIWHGLLHKEGLRWVKINVSQNVDEILCSIEDNGIGRSAAQDVSRSKKEKSMGLRLFNDRLQIKNSVSKQNYHYEMIDKYENGVANGTIVKLYFEL